MRKSAAAAAAALAALALALLLAPARAAAPAPTHPSWAGANAYYLWACAAVTRAAYLDAMRAAGMRVLRVFVMAAGAPPSVPGCEYVPDVEDPVGAYHDDALLRIDALLSDAMARGIKLTLVLHDRWALGCWQSDAYQRKYALPVSPDCARVANDASRFYANASAVRDFEARIAHVLGHRHAPSGGARYADLAAGIFSVEPENEPQQGDSVVQRDWLCGRARFMRGPAVRLNASIAITTGGGWAGAADPRVYAECDAIDVLTLHDYSSPAELKARLVLHDAVCQSHGKRYFVQEFGASGASEAEKRAAMAAWVAASAGTQAPWMFWMLTEPSAPDSLSTWTNETAWRDVLAPAAQRAATVTRSWQAWPEVWG